VSILFTFTEPFDPLSEDGSGVRIRGAECVIGRVVKGERTSFTGISFTLSSVAVLSVIEQEETLHF